MVKEAERRILALREEADRLEKETRLIDSLPLCPFCGGKPRISEIKPAWGSMNFGGDSDFSVACVDCGCRTKDYKDKESAVRSWSRRVSQ